jgi:ariadne-1
VRILLNHFKWDKEKLMERYYSDEQEAMFAEAKVVSPNCKIMSASGGKSSFFSSTPPTTFECEICYLTLSKAVSVFLKTNKSSHN